LPSSQSRSSPSSTVLVPNVRQVRSAVAPDMTRTQATAVSPAFARAGFCERQDRQPGHGSRPSCLSPLPMPPAWGLATIKANKRAPETSLSPDTNRGHQGAPGPTRNRALGTSEKPTSAPRPANPRTVPPPREVSSTEVGPSPIPTRNDNPRWRFDLIETCVDTERGGRMTRASPGAL
jgi:hypothetical protein